MYTPFSPAPLPAAARIQVMSLIEQLLSRYRGAALHARGDRNRAAAAPRSDDEREVAHEAREARRRRSLVRDIPTIF